jgi:hypothetical protein
MRAPRPAPGWTVEVDEHDVARWHVEAQTLEVRSISETQARIAAARELHRRLEIPPWRPWLRRTYTRCRVVEPIEHHGERTRAGAA